MRCEPALRACTAHPRLADAVVWRRWLNSRVRDSTSLEREDVEHALGLERNRFDFESDDEETATEYRAQSDMEADSAATETSCEDDNLADCDDAELLYDIDHVIDQCEEYRNDRFRAYRDFCNVSQTAARRNAYCRLIYIVRNRMGLLPFVDQSGMYSAVYGGHGLELVWIDMSDGVHMSAIKLIGDPNVPAGATSFDALMLSGTAGLAVARLHLALDGFTNDRW